MPQTGKILILLGIILIVAGLLTWLAGNKLTWFGHLPGDIRIDRENFRFYAPVTSMLIISVILSLIFWIVGKFLK